MDTDATNTESPGQLAKTPWRLVAVSVMGFYWAIDFLVPTFAHGIDGPFTLLPLLGFFAPLLIKSPRRLWRRIAFWLCMFEVCLSPLLWFRSMGSFMNPMGIRLSVLGIPVTTIWNAGEQFAYFVVRGVLFAIAAFCVSGARLIVSYESRAAEPGVEPDGASRRRLTP